MIQALWGGECIITVMIVNERGDYLCFVFNGTSLLYSYPMSIVCNICSFICMSILYMFLIVYYMIIVYNDG